MYFVFSKAILVSDVWNWIFKHLHPVLALPVSPVGYALLAAPAPREGNSALEVSPCTERCLPPCHALGSAKGLLPLEPTATCLWDRL